MSGGLFLRLGFASLVSSGAAGLLATLAAFLGSHLSGHAPGWWTAAALMGWLPMGFLAGIVVAGLPAFFAGAGLWAIGDTVSAARRPFAWAAAGTVVGAALWILLALVFGKVGEDGLDGPETVFLAAALVAGCGGALVFLALMKLGGAPPGPRR